MIQQLLSNLNLRDQTIVLSILSTSQDPVDLFNLTVGFVRKRVKARQERFFWEGQRIKSAIDFRTFFSKEATEMLERYVEQERKEAKDSEPLFVKRNRKPMDEQVLCMNLRLAQTKMNLVTDNEQSPLRAKRLRHIFRTACGMTGIDPGYTMCFMGHSSDMSALYLEKSPVELEDQYMRVEPLLTIYKTTTDETVRLLNSHLVETRQEIDSLNRRLGIKDDQIYSLEKELKEVEEKIPEMIDRAIQPYIEEFERQREIFLDCEPDKLRSKTENILALVKEKKKVK